MSLNGKRDDFTQEDLLAVASQIGEFTREAKRIIEEVCDIVADWPRYASEVDVPKPLAKEIQKNLRLFLSQ